MRFAAAATVVSRVVNATERLQMEAMDVIGGLSVETLDPEGVVVR
jgi:hypothetical protein